MVSRRPSYRAGPPPRAFPGCYLCGIDSAVQIRQWNLTQIQLARPTDASTAARLSFNGSCKLSEHCASLVGQLDGHRIV